MECPKCGVELELHDWYGTNMKFNGSGIKKGDIYKCDNEMCDNNPSFFYATVKDPDDLKEGYPC